MNREPFTHRLIRASAGSGKTHQLTTRYLALVARGVKPESILAATFTRKAAGEILNRVLLRLGQAAADAEPAKQLAGELSAPKLTQQDCIALLRRLLCDLHRMRIGTLDSFYIALAGGFGLELGLPAGWSICEPADDEALWNQALERLLTGQPDNVSKLVPLLNKGEVARSVHDQLLRVIAGHYECYRGTTAAAWNGLELPEPVAVAARASAIQQLLDFDLSVCGHKNFVAARDKDMTNFEREDWLAFVGSGLAGKTSYYKKPVPEAVQSLYGTLLQHAHAELLRALGEQTRATWGLLDGFHGELWALKQSGGGLRFHEVTQAIVDALARQALEPDALAFRLDGRIEHLLLDEFQDTALAQWRVLEPLARNITQAPAKARRSFFCVGDVKQAIYAWRGGMAEIFKLLPAFLGELQESTLEQSRRSALPIIQAVNQVFENVASFDVDEKYHAGLESWRARYERHTTIKSDLPGYVCLRTGPEQIDGDLAEQRQQHCTEAAKQIKALHQAAPQCSFGILCRQNKTIARMIYELRRLGIQASEEGGNPLTDSPAVQVVLSLLTLADHPGHSIAWFHLDHSPLKPNLASFAAPDALADHLRRQLQQEGYGRFAQHWAEILAPSCDQRDLYRLQQLVETAFAYQARSTLRPSDFVDWVEQQRATDPSGAKVRVMTIHGAKGLEFDIVVLPELDETLSGQPPSFVVGRDAKSLAANFVCRYAAEEVQRMLSPEQQLAFEQDRQQSVEESLSLLYVAMTRAIHGLYLFIPGPRKKGNRRDAWCNLLAQTLTQHAPISANAVLYEAGDAEWFKKIEKPSFAVASAAPSAGGIVFASAPAKHRRGLKHEAPSSREGGARVRTDRLFHPSEGTGMAAGTLYHAWFETIEWLDDGEPTEAVLRAAALAKRSDLPANTWRDLERLLADFRTWLATPAISGVLSRSAYGNTKLPAFPARLAPVMTRTLAPQKVERERRFLVGDEEKFWNGSFDRVVWLGDGDRIVAADVIDFKTDDLKPGDEKALAERVAHYKPQLDAYRQAAARIAGLAPERVAARLLFPIPGRVVEL